METKMLEKAKDVIDYIAFIITEFALTYKLSMRQAFDYLHHYGGIAFLDKHYGYEHTQNPVHTLEVMQRVCQRNGGAL